MAIIRNIVYPHVGITTNAAVRKSTPADESTATTLFAPFVAKKGPENVGVKIYSNSEFISTFGALDYSEQGQQVLNIGNWLNNGGAVLACRMTALPEEYNTELLKNAYFGPDDILYINGNATDVRCKSKKEYFDYNGNLFVTNIHKDETNKNVFSYSSISDITASGGVETNTDKLKVSYFDNKTILSFKTEEDGTLTLYYDYIQDITSLEKGGSTSNYYSVGHKKVTIDGKPYSLDDPMNMVANYMKTTYVAEDEDNDIPAKYPAIIKAKYSGAYYNDMKVRVQKQTESLFKITVEVDGVQVESFSRRKWDEIKTLDKYSEYIGYIKLGDDLKIAFLGETLKKSEGTEKGYTYDDTSFTEDEYSKLKDNDYVLYGLEYERSDYVDFNLSGGIDTEYDETLIATAIESALEDKLSVKCDLILDAGYKASTKQAIAEKIASLTDKKRVRDDLIFIADMYELDYKNNVIPTPSDGLDGHDGTYEARCLAVYDQYGTTEDIYSENSGVEVYVTPTYFLAGLIPYNDAHYGIGYPTAGKRRGVIEDALSINHNPTTAEKNEYYEQRINYIEKDSRSIQFMSQSTWTEENTALQYLNNSRVVNKIVTDIEALGRDYLFEYNDATTLNNLKNAITKYMNNWVLSRTLSKCIVSVEPGEDDKTVAVRLDIAFTGIIEVISIEINIE